MAIELKTLTTLKFQYDENVKTDKEDKEDLDGFSIGEENDDEDDDDKKEEENEEEYLE
ncbi:MAG: hypothetical protein ABIH10_00200 [Spirochaetota bacterium]